jgi:hypothetical protein
MRAHHTVEFRTGDVLAAAPDDVFLARNEVEVTVFIASHEITGEKPAVVECVEVADLA